MKPDFNPTDPLNTPNPNRLPDAFDDPQLNQILRMRQINKTIEEYFQSSEMPGYGDYFKSEIQQVNDANTAEALETLKKDHDAKVKEEKRQAIDDSMKKYGISDEDAEWQKQIDADTAEVMADLKARHDADVKAKQRKAVEDGVKKYGISDEDAETQKNFDADIAEAMAQIEASNPELNTKPDAEVKAKQRKAIDNGVNKYGISDKDSINGEDSIKPFSFGDKDPEVQKQRDADATDLKAKHEAEEQAKQRQAIIDGGKKYGLSAEESIGRQNNVKPMNFHYTE